MAKIQHIRMKGDKILATFEISEDEYKLIKPRSRRVLFASLDMLGEILTTGTLGNSNRVMLPNKVLNKHGIERLVKKARSNIFSTVDGKYLVVELQKNGIGVEFEEEGKNE
jgi:hypothetical protein